MFSSGFVSYNIIVMPTGAFAALKDEFLTYLEVERNRSERTVKNYDFYLRRFLEWSKLADANGVTLDLVRKYRVWLNRWRDDRGWSMKKSTQNYHLIAL